jgi:hypothetical protein
VALQLGLFKSSKFVALEKRPVRDICGFQLEGARGVVHHRYLGQWEPKHQTFSLGTYSIP